MIKKIIKNIFHYIGIDVQYYYPRGFIRFLKEQKKDLVGAEVGVNKGENALNILKYLPIKKLYLIDPYQEYKEYSDKVTIATQKGLSIAENQAHKRLNRFKDKIVWLKEFSDLAFKKIPEKLDFVYIDGNHNYEFVKKDIENYYPLLKEKGILAGHDIDCLDGVLFAFTDFIKKNNLPFRISEAERLNGVDWIIIKTKP